MAPRNTIRRRLHSYLRQPGNWRLKGLFLALTENSRAVGEAWPINPDTRRRLARTAPPALPGSQTLDYRGQPAIETNRTLAHRPDSRELSEARDVRSLSNDEVRDLQQGTGLDRDTYISRMLVDGSVGNLDVTWREELTETIMLGANVQQVARAAATETPVETKTGTVPTQDETPFASKVAEGAEAPADEQDYKATDYTCEKWMQRFEITDELVDSASPALLEEQIARGGRGVENRINREFINTLLDNASDHDADLSGSGNSDIKNLLLEPSELVADNDFDPTNVLIMHPAYLTELGGNNQFAGANINRVEGDADDVLGHRPFTLSGTVYDSGSVTYDFDADGDRGAVVFNSDHVHVVVYRNIEVSEFPERMEAIRDIQGGVASAWTDTIAVDPDDDGTFESVARVQR